MKHTKIIFALLLILGILLLAVGIWKIYDILLVNELKTGSDVASLRWTIIGAMGSWAGSVFGAIALVISIIALWQPQRVLIQVSVSTAIMMNPFAGAEDVDSYAITVKNVGMRPITITNVYLNFGGKRNDNIYVGMLNQGSVLQQFTVSFPKRLEPGEAFDYYLLKDKLNVALNHYEEKTPRKAPFYVCVAEVVKGQRYYKTGWTLRDFVGDKKDDGEKA